MTKKSNQAMTDRPQLTPNEPVVDAYLDAQIAAERRARFVRDVASAVNCNSAENTSNTPDFILAEFMVKTLEAFDAATVRRAGWYGQTLEAPGQVDHPLTEMAYAYVAECFGTDPVNDDPIKALKHMIQSPRYWQVLSHGDSPTRGRETDHLPGVFGWRAHPDIKKYIVDLHLKQACLLALATPHPLPEHIKRQLWRVVMDVQAPPDFAQCAKGWIEYLEAGKTPPE